MRAFKINSQSKQCFIVFQYKYFLVMNIIDQILLLKKKKIESNRITSLGSVLGPELVMLVINSAVFLNCSPYSPMTASFL